ncbi:substrate-binding periplasmic protein [Pseudoalteromonas piscicida]|uniref:ABC transporter substrate-binding protein n=1 Tax=Pseudoalteromonas piscicida TaxID=43662 RepID=A0A2A5JL16_PSEO7|nr:transporter substrate-binding domain-containing protein [Pseudoalteromonas piscicida]PCK30039.1 ABC transporter substrate-binding protein [Pseudoalteromonas piscicida]
MQIRLLPYLFALLTSFTAFAQQINVAVDHAPPYSIIEDSGEVHGLILDILTTIREQSAIDYQINAVPCPFSRCMRMLAQGEVDVMGGLIRTPKREKIMQFVDPAYMTLTSSFVFYARRDSDITVEQYTDLYTKRIAVMRGGAFYPRFDEDRELNKVPVFSERIAFDLLLKGRVDLVIAVEDTAEVAMEVLGQPIEKLKKVSYRHQQAIYGHMAMSNQFNDSPLAQKIRQAMARLAKEKQLDSVVAKYKLPPVSEHIQGVTLPHP